MAVEIMSKNSIAELERLELTLLLEAIKTQYGYDFHDYAKASMFRRVKSHMKRVGVKHISELIPLFIHSSDEFSRFVKMLSVVVTEMFS